MSDAVKPKTAVVMMNMGGPATLNDVEFFLTNLFTDREIIPLGPLQKYLGPYIAKRRTPKIQEQYKEIGGGSPIGKWTDEQGKGLCQILDQLSPDTAPHKHYIAFRYAEPLSETAFKEMEKDGVERAIAFSQYPQWSCTTSGSSYNHLWRELKRLGMGDTFKWSVIDRWGVHPDFINCIAKNVEEGLSQFDESVRDQVVIVFTAHSVPMNVVERGDTYVNEVAASVSNVMTEVSKTRRNPHVLSWQSKVGYLPWMVPKTGDVLENLGKKGHQHVLTVPIAFTSDHVETLFEIDIEYAEDAEKAGIKEFKRAPSLNGQPAFQKALANIVHEHLESGSLCSQAYPTNCSACVNPTCRSIMNPVKPHFRWKDRVSGNSTPQTVDGLQ